MTAEIIPFPDRSPSPIPPAIESVIGECLQLDTTEFPGILRYGILAALMKAAHPGNKVPLAKGLRDLTEHLKWEASHPKRSAANA